MSEPWPAIPGRLRQVIDDAKSEAGLALRHLTVLEDDADPYRFGRPQGHEWGRWFLEQVDRFVLPGRTIHLRGLHYSLVATADVLKSGNGTRGGTPYLNTFDDWSWLGDVAAAARWLEYVPFDRIHDGRNAEPEIYVPEEEAFIACKPSLTSGLQVHAPEMPEIPSLQLALPGIWPGTAFRSAQQPYRVVFLGEKASLGDVLRPIAKSIGAELLLPTGEATTTMVAELAARANDDGRRCAVLYFSDFDPAGHQMPVSVARKLQALRDLEYPTLEIEVHVVCLTLEQVKRLGLPSTPLKETELRADKWRAAMGCEQTEIDALCALRPDALREIVRDAIKPFYDPDIERRTRRAAAEWDSVAYTALRKHPRYAEASEKVELALAGIRPALADLETAIANLERANVALIEAQSTASDMLADLEFPPVVQPEADDLPDAPEPLFTTDADFVTATERLIAHKALEDEAET